LLSVLNLNYFHLNSWDIILGYNIPAPLDIQ
jgi:hypothetical protein